MKELLKSLEDKSVFDKWNMLGLLDSVNEDKKEFLANKYEENAQYLIKENINNYSWEVISFPIICRVIKNDTWKDEFTPKYLYETYKEKRDEVNAIIDAKIKEKGEENIDKEAEFCAYFSDIIFK